VPTTYANWPFKGFEDAEFRLVYFILTEKPGKLSYQLFLRPWLRHPNDPQHPQSWRYTKNSWEPKVPRSL